MNIKTFITAAVAALTLAACQAEQDEAALTTDEAVAEEAANEDIFATDEAEPKTE